MAGKNHTHGGEEVFRRLVETVEDYALCALDAEGRVIYWNSGAEHILGYSRDEALGRSLDFIFTEEDCQAGAPEQERRIALAQGRAEDERYHVRKGGARFWSSGLVVPVLDAQGALLGFGKILRDRTEQRELHDALRNRAAQLAQVDEDKNVFLAALAHELRTPLGVLLNAARLVRTIQPSDRERLAELIERQALHSERLIEDLLDIVRASRTKLRLQRQWLDLRAAASQAAEMVRAAMTSQQRRFTLVQPETPIMVLADPNRLLQIFVNLLNNAMKFTPAGGRITFSTTTEGAEAVIRVEDDGVGIPYERLEAIFDLFSQAHPGLPGSQLGVGIGLALTRDLVSLHGGAIQARSPGVGKGSQFTVRLPLAEGARSIHP